MWLAARVDSIDFEGSRRMLRIPWLVGAGVQMGCVCTQGHMRVSRHYHQVQEEAKAREGEETEWNPPVYVAPGCFQNRLVRIPGGLRARGCARPGSTLKVL